MTPWTAACQAPPLSLEFSRQEHWSGLACPPPGDLPHPGIEPRSPAFKTHCLPQSPPPQTCKHLASRSDRSHLEDFTGKASRHSCLKKKKQTKSSAYNLLEESTLKETKIERIVNLSFFFPLGSTPGLLPGPETSETFKNPFVSS